MPQTFQRPCGDAAGQDIKENDGPKRQPVLPELAMSMGPMMMAVSGVDDLTKALAAGGVAGVLSDMLKERRLPGNVHQTATSPESLLMVLQAHPCPGDRLQATSFTHLPHCLHTCPTLLCPGKAPLSEEQLQQGEERAAPSAQQQCMTFHRAFNITGTQPSVLLPQVSSWVERCDYCRSEGHVATRWHCSLTVLHASGHTLGWCHCKACLPNNLSPPSTAMLLRDACPCPEPCPHLSILCPPCR